MRGIARTIDAALNTTADPAVTRLNFSTAQLVSPEIRQWSDGRGNDAARASSIL
jgi:hypothetical protein